MHSRIRTALAAAVVVFAAGCAAPAAAPADPLPSWNRGATRDAILDFVDRVTADDSPERVEPSARIAVFDNDGTLWAEQPVYVQLRFALDRVRALAPLHPEWTEKEPFASVLRGDEAAALAGGERALLDIVTATHAGTTTEEFEILVADWIAGARHPDTGLHHTAMAYRPMLELLTFLRSRGFRTWIVSGGGVEFVRPWSDDVYGVPPEQVIGSAVKVVWESREGRPALVRKPEIAFLDDGEAKPVGIHRHIGRRPLMAFGNSDGDLPMLQWTDAGEGPRFCAIVHHTDAAREWAYDRSSHVGRLDRALDAARERRWTVVDMASDWETVFVGSATRRP